MTRVSVPYHLSTGKPSGPRWTAYRKVLIAGWTRRGLGCYYCAHPFSSPSLIEICHLISPIVAPHLAWDPDNLVPGHGRNAGAKGNRRCPECLLNCNYVAAIAPDMAKDPDTGADLPFTPEFIARQVKLLADKRNPSGNPGVNRARSGLPFENRAKASKTTPNTDSDSRGVGREW